MRPLILFAIMTVVLVSIIGVISVYYYAVLPSASQPTTSPSNELDTTWINEVNNLLIKYKPYPTFDPLNNNLALRKVWLHENGEEQFVAATSMENEIVNYLENTISRINLKINCSLTEEQIEDVLQNDKVVELNIRHWADYNTTKFTLENVHEVLFIMEDKLNQGFGGYIIIGLYASDPQWSCYAIQK